MQFGTQLNFWVGYFVLICACKQYTRCYCSSLNESKGSGFDQSQQEAKWHEKILKSVCSDFQQRRAGSVSKIIKLCASWRSMGRENWPRPGWLPSVFPQTSHHLNFSSHRQGRFSFTSLQTFPSEHGAYLRETKDIRTQTDCMYISNPGHKESEPLQWYLIPKNHTKRAHKGDRRQQWCCMWLR